MTDSQEKQGYILESSDEDTDQTVHQDATAEESYRREIEDIVKGFILEKDLMSQGHEEQMIRMKETFQREKVDLLRHLEEERESLRQNSRMTSVTSNETGYASGSHAESEAYNFYSGELASPKRQATSLSSSGEVDNNLIKEIAEVYLRMNNGMITSGVRPDLDIEDKFEREREILESKFVAEKREMKRKLEDDYNHKLEQEKNQYEGQIQELKTTITDLQWQKRELESRNRNEKEKNEIIFERERNDLEKRHSQAVHDMKRKLEGKYSTDISKQKDQYEENISELQEDIHKLTSQLRELNENLRQEKEIIVEKFEREIKEMERTFSDQRNTLKITLESEFALKLENELSVLKSVNKKLQDDFEYLEREKKEAERKQKDERRKLEEHYDREISDMEKRHAEEKRNMKLKIEERYQQLMSNEQTSVEVTINELREEVILLRQENSQIDSAFSERNEELRLQLSMEREEYRKKLENEKDDLKVRLENEFHQKMLNENTGHFELVQQLDRDLGIMKARYAELEGNLVTIRQERDILAREREEMQRKFMTIEFELEKRTNTSRTEFQNDEGDMEKLKDVIRKKDQEISTANLQREQTEIAMSALKRVKMDLEDEITNLKRKVSSVVVKEEPKVERPSVDNSELVSLQENVRRKDEEMQYLKRDKFELDSRLTSVQRKNEEMEDELSALRRKKLEVEDEISSIKRDKSDSDNQISVLKREKIDLEGQIGTLKKKQAELEDNLSAFAREKMNMEHEISLLKRTIDNLEEEVKTLKEKMANDHEQPSEVHSARGSRTQRTDMNPELRRRYGDNFYHSEGEIVQQNAQMVCKEFDKELDVFNTSTKSIENDFDELVRQNRELEATVQRLEESKADLERDIAKLKHQSDSASVTTNQRKDMDSKLESLKEDYLDLENRILKLRREESGLEGHIEVLKNNEQDLKKEINDLNIEEKRLHKDIERFQEEKETLKNTLKDMQQQGQGSAQQGNGRKITGISQVSIERVRKHDSKDHELAELRKERDSLKREIEVLKKNIGSNNFNQSQKVKKNDNSNNAMSYSKEMNEMERNEVVTLKKERLQLEKSVAGLQRQKTEMDTEVMVILETKKREETDLRSLRREKMELDTQVATLSSKKTRLEAELFVVKDDKKKDDTTIENLRREKHEIERQFYDLQSKKMKMEAELSATEKVWKNKDNSLSDWHRSDSLKIENDLKDLKQQRTEIELEIKRLQSTKSREEHELNVLRRQMKDLQSQISESVRVAEQVNSLSTTIVNRDIDEQPWTQTDGATQDSPRKDPNQFLHPSKPRIRTSIEIPHLGTRSTDGRGRSFDTSECFLIPKTQTNAQDSEREHTSKRPSDDMVDGERGYTRGYHVKFSADGNVTTFSGPNEVPVTSCDNSNHQMNGYALDERNGRGMCTCTSVHDNGHHARDPGPTSRSNEGLGNSFNNYGRQIYPQQMEGVSGSQHEQPNQNGCYYCSSSSTGNGRVKENNDITVLRRERQKLEFQISEMREELKKLQANVSELENVKNVRETFNGQSDAADRQREEELKKEIVREKYEVSSQPSYSYYELSDLVFHVSVVADMQSAIFCAICFFGNYFEKKCPFSPH